MTTRQVATSQILLNPHSPTTPSSKRATYGSSLAWELGYHNFIFEIDFLQVFKFLNSATLISSSLNEFISNCKTIFATYGKSWFNTHLVKQINVLIVQLFLGHKLLILYVLNLPFIRILLVILFFSTIFLRSQRTLSFPLDQLIM